MGAAVQRLRIDVGLLAADASVNPDAWNVAGRYSTTQAGGWLVTKLFVPVERRSEDDEEFAEIFLALNEGTGAAELSVKDSDYWPLLSEALARVF